MYKNKIKLDSFKKNYHFCEMIKTTEQDSTHRHLDKMSTLTLLQRINDEDKTVAYAVENVSRKSKKWWTR